MPKNIDKNSHWLLITTKECYMAVKIRFSRIGATHVPFYRIVAVDSRKPRDGAFLEDLGTYDVLKSELVTFKPDRIAARVAQGAVLTDSVKKIYKKYMKTTAAATVQSK